jgi:PiT family inorganic phosphate transporter
MLKIISYIFIAPLLGFLIGGGLMVIVSWLCRNMAPRKVDKYFRRLQLLSAAAYSLGHGGNDAQKTVGIIWMLLVAAGVSQASDAAPPGWVVFSCYAAMGIGTMFGGWRIVKTMGNRITKLNQARGFCANSGGAITLFMATALSIPVSTTHTITGAIAGVGSTRGARRVRWGVAGGIVWAWILTIPCSAAMAALAWYLGTLIL